MPTRRRPLPVAALAPLAAALAVAAVFGPAPPAGADPIVIGETASIRSRILDEERALRIYLPAGYERSEDRYPVMVLLDGDTRFHHTTGTVDVLTRGGHIPPLIVVGVGNTDRTRDLTPTHWDGDPDDGVDQLPTSGGAGAFLRFLTEELAPWVDATYRTQPYRILVGHSFGGLFAIHALTSAPEGFDAYISISPSLDWDGDLMFRQANERFRGGLPGPRHLYLTLGDEGGDALAAFERFEELLRHRAPAALRWETRLLADDDHGSVPLYSVQLGLRSIFDVWRAPAFVMDEGIPGLERHAARLTDRYGFEVRVPENLVNLLGYRLLGEGKPEEAVAAFEWNVEHYPRSANVHDSLGEGLEAAGRLAEAEAAYARAVARGEQIGDPNTPVYRQHLEAARQRRAGGAAGLHDS